MNLNYNDRLAQEFQKELESKSFPTDLLTNQWCSNAFAALQYGSPVSLGVKPSYFKELLDLFSDSALKIRKLNCFQFAILSNNLEVRSAKDLFLSLNDYAELMETAEKLTAKWQQITFGMKEKVEDRINDELRMKERILKPIIAEA